MDFSKCNRCGSFYINEGSVCPKCYAKDNLELATFKSYVGEFGLNDSISSISVETGISQKNINRYIENGNFEINDTTDQVSNKNTGYTNTIFN